MLPDVLALLSVSEAILISVPAATMRSVSLMTIIRRRPEGAGPLGSVKSGSVAVDSSRDTSALSEAA